MSCSGSKLGDRQPVLRRVGYLCLCLSPHLSDGGLGQRRFDDGAHVRSKYNPGSGREEVGQRGVRGRRDTDSQQKDKERLCELHTLL